MITFNNHFTHRCLPALFGKKNCFEVFYQNILLNPSQLQGFLVNFMQVVAQNAGENVGKPFKADSFEISLYGTIEKGIIYIDIPYWEQSRDCVAIAFPTDTAHGKFDLYLLAHRLVLGAADVHVPLFLFALGANGLFV